MHVLGGFSVVHLSIFIWIFYRFQMFPISDHQHEYCYKWYKLIVNEGWSEKCCTKILSILLKPISYISMYPCILVYDCKLGGEKKQLISTPPLSSEEWADLWTFFSLDFLWLSENSICKFAPNTYKLFKLCKVFISL